MQVLYSAENYNPQASPDYNLALAISEKAVAYAVHNADGVLLHLAHNEFYVSLDQDETVFFDFIRGQEVLKQKYKTTKVVVDGYKTTLVPTELFNELYIESYLRHIYETESKEIVKEVALLNDTIKLVFATKEYLFYPARSKYYDADIEPHAAHYIRKSTLHHTNKLNVFIEQGDMYLVHSQNNSPIYFNRFAYTTADEAAYYILNYYQVFAAQPQNTPVLLHGNVPPQLAQMLLANGGKVETAAYKNSGVDATPNFEFEFLIDFSH
jgi:hypothetical protein